ncbi:MAG: retropepsin-like aspartic protease [Candidatus Kuenenbacteria bacterium]
MQKRFNYFKKGDQWFPIIEVTLQGPKIQKNFMALIDSGASYSIFRSEVAELLGLQVEKGKQIYLEGIGGRILGYIHEVNLSVNKKIFKCKIIFSKEFLVSFNLLGRNNFFFPFLITFNETKKFVLLKDNF